MEGIELNQEAVQVARKAGRPVHLTHMGELGEQARRYDALCSFQVLEHLPDPGKFLEVSCSILQPGGKLLLGVPNVDSFLRYQWNLLDLPPHHMSRWSNRLLHRIPEFYPLRVVHVKTEPLAEYHVECYVGAYLSPTESSGLMRLLRAFHVRGALVKCLKATGARKLLRGQTLYVCYERT
jgi:SAM-dependent methyltransferase